MLMKIYLDSKVTQVVGKVCLSCNLESWKSTSLKKEANTNLHEMFGKILKR